MEKRKIKFGDVSFDRKARERINNIMISGRNTEGHYVEKFEGEFAKAFGFKYAIMTSSGTTAGEVVWMAIREKWSVRWGSGTVATPALAFGSTANCIMRAGLSPHMVDVEPDLNMQTPSREWLTLGVQFVANMGRSVRIDEVCEYADSHNLFFVVDACEGHGAEFDGKRICDYADAAIYSFYPAHIMTVGGEGGMIVTDDSELADLCRSIKSHGRPAGTITHEFLRIGTNAKSTEIAAAVGLSALEDFPENFKKRRELRNKLLLRLNEFDLTLFPDAPKEVIAPHAFPVLVDKEIFNSFCAHLREWQIEFKPLWGALSNHSAYHWLNIPSEYFPVAEDIGSRGVHWGCHESMTDDDLDYIYDVIAAFFNGDLKLAA